MQVRHVILGVALSLLLPRVAAPQVRNWVVEGTIGWAGLVDDSTKNYVVIGGAVRRHLSPRVSVGPELVLMRNPDLSTDRLVMLTGNLVFDFLPLRAMTPPRVTPFVVAGAGMFSSRDLVRNGPFWSSDPAFTVGGGARGRLADAVSIAAEYRFGWELHQRLSGLVALDF